MNKGSPDVYVHRQSLGGLARRSLPTYHCAAGARHLRSYPVVKVRLVAVVIAVVIRH